MKKFIYSLMTDQRKGLVYLPLIAILYAASFFYALGIGARKLLYAFGVFRRRRVPLKVISVGNLTLGGTGKTPFVIALAKIVKEELKKEVGVLIRGYGWDEQELLKKSLPDIPILVGEDRVRSSRKAIRFYGSDTVILDDGFQYWELERDLDIVLIDSRNPFGNGHLFPRGILREPKDVLRRADIVVFTKVNKKNCDIRQISEGLTRIKKDIVFLEAVHRPLNLYHVRTKEALGLERIKGKRVILLSSIGDAGYFEETIKDLGSDVITHIIFPDHHDYKKKDIDAILKHCNERTFDSIVTTEKDSVKLNRFGFSVGSYPVLVLAVTMDIIRGREELIARLHRFYTR